MRFESSRRSSAVDGLPVTQYRHLASLGVHVVNVDYGSQMENAL